MAISNNPAKAAAALAEEQKKRVRAARQAANTKADETPVEMVKCRVTHKGDGKISMGQHVGGIGEVHYEKGEVFDAEASIAIELQERGLAEIA